MTWERSVIKIRLLQAGIFAGALFIIAAVIYDGFNWNPREPEVVDDRSFDTTGSECDDLDPEQYDDIITPLYTPWEPFVEVSSDRGQRESWSNCVSQAVIVEGHCEKAAEADCIDWNTDASSVVIVLRLTISYYESDVKAAESLETEDYESVPPSGIWDELYESVEKRSWSEEMRLVSIFLADNMTIEMHSLIGKSLHDQAIIDEIFEAHAALAEGIARNAEL